MFIVLPVGMNYQTQRLPVVTFSLIGINTFIWLVTTFFFFSTKGESDLWIMQHFWLIPSQSVLLTYLTSMFVHAGFFHLLGNMIFLFLFGCCVEDMLGRVRFIMFYLVGGLLAELAYIASTPIHFASNIPMGGASGAQPGAARLRKNTAGPMPAPGRSQSKMRCAMSKPGAQRRCHNT